MKKIAETWQWRKMYVRPYRTVAYLTLLNLNVLILWNFQKVHEIHHKKFISFSDSFKQNEHSIPKTCQDLTTANWFPSQQSSRNALQNKNLPNVLSSKSQLYKNISTRVCKWMVRKVHKALTHSTPSSLMKKPSTRANAYPKLPIKALD